MGWMEDKETLEEKRRESHRRYMLAMAEIEDSEQLLQELQEKIPALKAKAHRLRCRRDRLDEEWAGKYSDDEKNKKQAKLEKLESEIRKIKSELGEEI